MLTSLLLATQLAHAGSDIGTDKKLGVGASTGDVYLAFSGKYWLSEKSGLTATLGTAFYYQAFRVGFESNIVTVGDDWSFGQLPIYWHADVELAAYTVPYAFYHRVAVGGGAGAALQFDSVPAEVFVNVGLTVGYSGYCGTSYVAALCVVRPLGTVGGRWYF